MYKSEQLGNRKDVREMYIIPYPDKIKAKRLEKDLSAYALAMIAGLDKKAIYRIESGESNRTHHLRAQAIADALDCPIEELFKVPNSTEREVTNRKASA